MGTATGLWLTNKNLRYWENLILFAIFLFYFIQLGFRFIEGSFPVQYGEDFLAFWSTGKIASEMGYSKIYDYEAIGLVQNQALRDLGFPVMLDDPNLPAMMMPNFSVFVIPFQFFWRINPEIGYWIWTVLNLVLLVGYLRFFVRNGSPTRLLRTDIRNNLLPYLVFFPVLTNLIEGQINILLLVFTGEFIRNSINKKPVMAGLWLGGLLLKPQLLILIIPVIMLFRNYKITHGFIVSTGAIIITSTALSGFSGMRELLTMWLAFLGNGPGPAAANMINWRMVGVNINNLFQSSNGWIITLIGSILTFTAFFFLIKKTPAFGSPDWVITMLGVFSATLAVTWHAHYAMAVVLIPFLVYGSLYGLIPDQTRLQWIAATPAVSFLIMIISTLIYILSGNRFVHVEGLLIALSGLVVNLAILVFTIRYAALKAKPAD